MDRVLYISYVYIESNIFVCAALAFACLNDIVKYDVDNDDDVVDDVDDDHDAKYDGTS